MTISSDQLAVKHAIDIFIRANSAETGPPLGTILGNLGLNSAKFCKDFNELTKELPNYFVLKVRILVYENRTLTFSVKAPTTSFFLSCLKFEKMLKDTELHREHKRLCYCIKLEDLVKIAKFKLFTRPLNESLFRV